MIPRNVSEEDSNRINNPITLEELKWAINSLANEKSLGCDGLLAKLYKTNIYWIFIDFLALYKDSFGRGSLERSIKKGMIKLIPKNGDKAEKKIGDQQHY